MSTHVKRHRRSKKKQVEFLLPGESQYVGVITKPMGNGHFMVSVKDMPEMNARLRGSLGKKRIGPGAAVIVEVYLNVVNIIYIYPAEYMKDLKETGLLPKTQTSLMASSDKEGEDEDEEEAFDFDEI